MKKLIKKLGYYKIFEEKLEKTTKYIVDNGKILYSTRFKKNIPNPYRDIKEFNNIKKAEDYILLKLKNNNIKKEKKISKLPKSLYLILIKEISSNTIFVKVGITSKKFIMNRFSKQFGYEGYVVETILRRIDTPMAEDLESEIKEKLNKNKAIKKYRPLLESFSGYSECYDYKMIDNIINIFDEITKKY